MGPSPLAVGVWLTPYKYTPTPHLLSCRALSFYVKR